MSQDIMDVRERLYEELLGRQPVFRHPAGQMAVNTIHGMNEALLEAVAAGEIDLAALARQRLEYERAGGKRGRPLWLTVPLWAGGLDMEGEDRVG